VQTPVKREQSHCTKLRNTSADFFQIGLSPKSRSLLQRGSCRRHLLSLIDIVALFRNGFSEETAQELFAQGEEIAIFVMLQPVILAAKTAEVNVPPGLTHQIFTLRPLRNPWRTLRFNPDYFNRKGRKDGAKDAKNLFLEIPYGNTHGKFPINF